jgi:hypothetical protein
MTKAKDIVEKVNVSNVGNSKLLNGMERKVAVISCGRSSSVHI